MAYREPGPYLELVNTTPMVGTTPTMYSCVIGAGPKFIDFNKTPLVRAADAIIDPEDAGDVIIVADSEATGSLDSETMYYYVTTLAGPAGESAASPEKTFTTGIGKTSLAFSVASKIKEDGVFPPGVASINIYISSGTGTEKYIGKITDVNGVLTVGELPAGSANTFPTINTTPWSDVLPSSKVTTIFSIFTLVGGVASDIPSANNWNLTGNNIISWTNGGPDVPGNGVTYYVNYEARPEASQYEVNLVTNFSQLESLYGGQFMKLTSGGAKTVINPIGLGAHLILETGAAGVKVAQVEPSNKGTYDIVEATDFQNTLDNHIRHDESIYRICPVTRESSVLNAVASHVSVYSSSEERKERRAYIGKEFSALTKSTLISELKSYVRAFKNRRVTVPFPDMATKILSDGKLHTLGHEYICCAVAGAASVIPIQRSMTRQRVYNFVSLGCSVGTNTRFTRTELNDIAEAGVMLLTQPGGSGTPIIVRHQLTTNMDTIADREESVVEIADYTAKLIRSSLDGYIGVYNINADVITRIRQTVNLILTMLIRDHILSEGKLTSIAQDTVNADTILLSIRIKPEIPCNYIYITLLLE